MKKMYLWIAGLGLVLAALAGCGPRLDEGALADSIAEKLNLDEKLTSRIDQALVEDVVAEVFETQDAVAVPVKVVSAVGSWAITEVKHQLGAEKMAEADCQAPDCVVVEGSCEAPVEVLQAIKVTQWGKTEGTVSYDPANETLEDEDGLLSADHSVEDGVLTITADVARLDQCEEAVGIGGQTCEVWQMTMQAEFAFGEAALCQVKNRSEREFGKGEGIEVAEAAIEAYEDLADLMSKCEEQELTEGEEVACEFAGEVTFEVGDLKLAKQTTDLDTYLDWLDDPTRFTMLLDYQGEPKDVIP